MTFLASTSSIIFMYQDTLLCIFAYISPKPRSFYKYINAIILTRPGCGCPVLYVRQVYHVTESREHSFFLSSAQLTGWPRWLSPKDALSLPEGVVILHSPLWWTMQLDWGSLLCVRCESACVCCLCTVCWDNSWIRISLKMKRRNLSRFTSRSSWGASALLLLKWLQWSCGLNASISV